MKKREKIIVILTLVVVLYGLIDFFVLSKKNKLNQTEQLIADTDQDTKKFAAQATSKISKLSMMKTHNDWQTLVSKIESNWERDPFVQALQSDTQMALPVADIIYSGYIKAGSNSFAIINGIEYKSGELIQKYEYQVVKITTKKVILQKDLKQGIIYLKEN